MEVYKTMDLSKGMVILIQKPEQPTDYVESVRPILLIKTIEGHTESLSSRRRYNPPGQATRHAADIPR